GMSGDEVGDLLRRGALRRHQHDAGVAQRHGWIGGRIDLAGIYLAVASLMVADPQAVRADPIDDPFATEQHDVAPRRRQRAADIASYAASASDRDPHRTLVHRA